jgi:hypothetical protein
MDSIGQIRLYYTWCGTPYPFRGRSKSHLRFKRTFVTSTGPRDRRVDHSDERESSPVTLDPADSENRTRCECGRGARAEFARRRMIGQNGEAVGGLGWRLGLMRPTASLKPPLPSSSQLFDEIYQSLFLPVYLYTILVNFRNITLPQKVNRSPSIRIHGIFHSKSSVIVTTIWLCSAT